MQRKEQQVYDAIKTHFSGDRRRVKFISHLIVSLLKITNCSLSEWSRAIAQPTQRASRYKRLQRFVAQFRFSGRIYARVVWSVFGQGNHVVLTLDRTEYQMRGEWIQVLMLGIAHQGISIPLLWHTSNRQGNASQGARRALLKAFTTWLPRPNQQRVYLAADREFIGPECRQAPFIPLIRIRSNALVGPKKASQPVHKLFHVKTLRILRKPRKLYGQWLYLAGMQLPNGDFFILATTAYLSNIALLYAQRWQIETLFGAYKSRGFHWEDCRVTQHRRIHTLLFVLAISLIWAIRTGQWLIRQGQGIIQKRFKKDQHKRPLLSVFRHGLDHLQDVVLNHADFQNLTMLLSCT
jgi:hypothetical protein